MADFRRLALFVTIGSFSVAAFMGVLALVGGGDFGEGEARVLLTTLLVGVTSIAVLCYLATAGTAYSLVGALGAACAIPTLLIGLVLVWSDDWSEGMGQAFGVGTTVSASLAQVSLLLVLASSAAAYVRRLLAATLVAVAWVAIHVSVLIIDFTASDGSLRLLGVVAILDVLGTVLVAALGKFGSRVGSPPRLVVPDDLVPLVLARADATGADPEQAVRSLLTAGLAADQPR